MKSRTAFGLILASCVALIWSIDGETSSTNLRLQELIAKSDIIVVAAVGERQRVGPAKIEYHGRTLEADNYRVQISCLRSIKGDCPTKLDVHFSIPRLSVGYGIVGQGTMIVFLQRHSGQTEFTNLYYPGLPAAPAVMSKYQYSGEDSFDAVVREFVNALESPMLKPEEKSYLLANSYALPRQNALINAALLNALTHSQDPGVAHWMRAILLLRGDVSQLGSVVEFLEQGLAVQDRERYLYGIANGVKNPTAVPNLERLYRSTDSGARVAALHAMWNVSSPLCIPTLVLGLSDTEEYARYFAVRGLASTTGDLAWGPSIPEFEARESHYLEHWNEWANSRRRGQPEVRH